MSTYRELVHMALDELKLISDDSIFTEDHVAFLLDKYRAFILKQKYSDVKKDIPDGNYQTICLDTMQIPSIPLELEDTINPCLGGLVLRSKYKIPDLMKLGSPKVYPVDFYQGEITFISKERMKYVGYNKYLQNIIYCSLGPDNYLYFKSSNPQYLYLEKVRLTGIFQDSIKASELQCEDQCGNTICDPMDREFPLEDSLISLLIQSVVKELAGPSWKPQDNENNASDDLANLATYIAKNAKSALQKKMTE